MIDQEKREQPATVTSIVDADGRVQDPCEVLAVAMLLGEPFDPGSSKRIAFELGGTDAVHTYNTAGEAAMAMEVGESHVFDYLVTHPDLVERAGCKVVNEPAPTSASKRLTWEDMQPRLAAVGLADFPASCRVHDSYSVHLPGGGAVVWGCMSVDDALAELEDSGDVEIVPGVEVDVCTQMPVAARVDGDAVLDDALEGIRFDTGSDLYEGLYDQVTPEQLADLSERLTACLAAWMADIGISLDGQWYGMSPRRFRRGFDGTWEEVA